MQAAAGVVAGSALVVAAARAVYMLTADQEAGADAQLERDGGRDDDDDDDDLEAQHLPSSPPVASPEVESYAPYDPPPALEFPDPPSKIVPKT